MTTLVSQEWLTMRGGELRPGLSPTTWMIVLSDHPLYRLDVLPAGGKFTCVIVQTNNGKRLDAGKSYSDADTAFAGGLAELREKLGW